VFGLQVRVAKTEIAMALAGRNDNARAESRPSNVTTPVSNRIE
jgi:hypothetical protein